jgi:NADPH:quinone reductase-like Zn-dependent oxidoreductase
LKALVLARYGSPDDLQVQEVEPPVPKDHQVLVRVKAAAVNDWDWCLVRGSPFYIRLLCGWLRPKVRIPGVDIAGEVVAVGTKVTSLRPGDQVHGDLSEAGFGGFAELVCAPATSLALKPVGMSHAEAAAMPHAALLALQGLRDLGRLQPGQRVLINGGGGGVGTLGVQLAKAMGAAHVTGVDHGGKLAAMRAAGFDEVFDYRTHDFTRGRGDYDLVLDPKTDRSIFSYLRALKPGGTYVTVGGGTLRLLQAVLLSRLIRFFSGKSVRVLGLKPNHGLDDVGRLFEAGKLRPVIDGPFPLGQAAGAIRRFGEGGHTGKVIIAVGD